MRGSGPAAQENGRILTGEETTLSPEELNDGETSGEIPEKEPARQNDGNAGQ